jgi:hypothetical protein
MLLPIPKYEYVSLGGIVFSVLATGAKVSAFEPIPGRWIFKDDNNPQQDFLQREVQPLSCNSIFVTVMKSLKFNTPSSPSTTRTLNQTLGPFYIGFIHHHHHLRFVHSTAVFLHPNLSFDICLCL